MREGQPSRTALAAAAHRAIHQVADTPPVFDDPLAADVLFPEGPEAALLLGERAMRAFICARARLAEDALAKAVRRGVRQYLLLGAGLDTFAWRNPYPGLRVFEADHPSTQAWKRARMAPLGIPRDFRYLPLDLEHEPLFDMLISSGIDIEAPLFVSALGVTPYLESQTVIEVLEALVRLPGGVEVVFDYGPAPSSLRGVVRSTHERRAAAVAQAGEPWVSAFEPRALIDSLSALGFAHIQDAGPAELNERYFAGRDDRLRVLAGRVMRAAN